MSKEMKRLIILVVGVVILVVGIKLIQNYDKIGKQLREIGYSKEDSVKITSILSEEDVSKVLNMEYQEKLIPIIENNYFIPKNLEKYLDFKNKNNDKNVEDIIAIVNVKQNNDWYENTTNTDISKGNAMLVNKFHSLTEDFDPGEIVKISVQYAYDGHSTTNEVYEQYKKMWYAAKEENLTLIVNSSYRTYSEQEKTYKASGDEYAARTGFSEHQTGLALDIVTYNTIGNDFENKPEFTWLSNNAHLYGFILRFPKNKEYLTGFEYESWHYRYLGVDLATKVYESGLTYDEYYAYYCDYKNEC